MNTFSVVLIVLYRLSRTLSAYFIPTEERMLMRSRITGTEQDDYLVGGKQADTIYGFGGNDVIHGGYGKDKIFGGDGDDIIIAAPTCDFVGDDLYGGAGNDTFVYEHPDASPNATNQRDTIYDFEAGDKIDLSAISHGSVNQWVPLTFAENIEMIPIKGGWRVIVTSDNWSPEFTLAIDVLGVQPTENNFIL